MNIMDQLTDDGRWLGEGRTISWAEFAAMYSEYIRNLLETYLEAEKADTGADFEYEVKSCCEGPADDLSSWGWLVTLTGDVPDFVLEFLEDIMSFWRTSDDHLP